MTDLTARAREIKRGLDRARNQILRYNGLYTDEDLIRDVLRTCHEAASGASPHPRLDATGRHVEARCKRLVHVADRFATRDIALMASARAQAVAAVDVFQDVVVEMLRADASQQIPFTLLKKRAR